MPEAGWRGKALHVYVLYGRERRKIQWGEVGLPETSQKNIYTENDSESGEAITQNAIHVEKSTGTKPLRQEAGNFRERVPP